MPHGSQMLVTLQGGVCPQCRDGPALLFVVSLAGIRKVQRCYGVRRLSAVQMFDSCPGSTCTDCVRSYMTDVLRMLPLTLAEHCAGSGAARRRGPHLRGLGRSKPGSSHQGLAACRGRGRGPLVQGPAAAAVGRSVGIRCPSRPRARVVLRRPSPPGWTQLMSNFFLVQVATVVGALWLPTCSRI